MRDGAAGGEGEGELLGVGVHGRMPFHDLHVDLAVGVVGPTVLEQSRGARVFGGGAGPGDAAGLVETFVGDAVVVVDRSGGGDAQFLEDLAGAGEVEVVPRSEAPGEFADDPGVGAHAGGGSWALLCLTTRASALAITPSSSAQVVTGKTTWALAAVSERKKSNWAWNSAVS